MYPSFSKQSCVSLWILMQVVEVVARVWEGGLSSFSSLVKTRNVVSCGGGFCCNDEDAHFSSLSSSFV